MNYRHIYHAGNICDVVKHTALTLLLKHLRGKESGFFVLDTHAGIGLYDLQDERAAKTGEAKAGILKLLEAPPLPELEDYYSVLKSLNALQDSLRYYPGSPLIAQSLLRPQDRLVLCELHPDDVETLRRFVPQANIHHRDGYGALKAFLPPPEKRGPRPDRPAVRKIRRVRAIAADFAGGPSTLAARAVCAVVSHQGTPGHLALSRSYGGNRYSETALRRIYV